jgi:hypothetical protein
VRLAELGDELARLQAGRRQDRRAADLVAEGRALLRSAKRRLEPLVAGRGYHFHGRAIRKSRRGANGLSK